MARLTRDMAGIGQVWYGAFVGAGFVIAVFVAMPILMIAYVFWDKLLRALGVL